MMDVLHHLEDARPVLAEMTRLVRPGGAIVVADFSEVGFAMVDAVHHAAGQVHARSVTTLEVARALLSSLGWLEGGRAEGHHHVVAWFRGTGTRDSRRTPARPEDEGPGEGPA